jgi:poly-gamma-glutamate capsule biosynthesis protein CapA/YwtB (metallophosphatase superfamily)
VGPGIGLLGDVMLGRSVAEALSGRPAEQVWSDEVRALAGSLDLIVANLECCLSDRGARTARIPGKPFFFRGPPSAAGALRAVGVGAVGLANNHALDYGEDALADTLATVAAAGIAPAGAGASQGEAREPALVPADGLSVGIVAVSDHPTEYAAAGDSPGVAHADLGRGVPGWLGERVEELRRRCELVVAFPHWGPNMTTEPAAWQRRAARELQEAGADLVAGHSAHVFHGVEWTDGGPILSDLGDALDDYRVDPELRNDLGVLAIWRPEAGELELAGLRLDFCFTELARGADADWIAARLERACGELGTAVERVGEQRFRVARC